MIEKICQWLAARLPSITIPDIEGKPYLTRYFFFGKERAFFNIFLHYFHASDKDRSPYNGSLLLHTHGWRWSVSLILAGGYLEERRQKDGCVAWKAFPPGHFNYLNDKRAHRVDLLRKHGWSLFFTGWRRNKEARWGFWDRHTKEYTDAEVMLKRLGKNVFIP